MVIASVIVHVMVESALVAALAERGGPFAAACLRALVYGEELPAPAARWLLMCGWHCQVNWWAW